MQSDSLADSSSARRAISPSSMRSSRSSQISASDAEPSTATSAARRRPMPRNEASSTIISRIVRPGRSIIALRSFSAFFCSSLAIGATVAPRHSNTAAVAKAASRKSEQSTPLPAKDPPSPPLWASRGPPAPRPESLALRLPAPAHASATVCHSGITSSSTHVDAVRGTCSTADRGRRAVRGVRVAAGSPGHGELRSSSNEQIALRCRSPGSLLQHASKRWTSRSASLHSIERTFAACHAADMVSVLSARVMSDGRCQPSPVTISLNRRQSRAASSSRSRRVLDAYHAALRASWRIARAVSGGIRSSSTSATASSCS
eukprot:scaffold12190_cov120-Isochrysis_galbana.AAC.7